jgi:type I restriction-modification system DNA methylase subunit
MSTESATIVQRLWSYCKVLRDDGVSYGDYVEQITYLLFLKMVDEQEREFGKASAIPPEYRWASLRGLEGAELERIRAEKTQRETERKPKGKGSRKKKWETEKAQQLELF